MVKVVTEQSAEEQNAATVQAAEATAAEEMATAAQEAAVSDEPAAVEEPSSEQKDWDELLNDEEAVVPDEPVVPPVTEEVVPPVEEPAEVIPPAEIPPAEVVPPAEETPSVSEVVPPVEEPPADTRTPEEVTAEITKARQTAHERLVETFTWTDEQTEQFEDDPGKVMSEMAASLYLDLFDSISQGLNANMPGMVQGIMHQQVAVQAAEEQFYGAWPKLSNPEYRETVNRIATAYRQQNPTTDNATAVREIGAQAWVALQLPLEELVALTQTTQVPTVETVVIPPTHVPASAGNAPHAAHVPAVQNSNDFTNLADELLLDDKEM